MLNSEFVKETPQHLEMVLPSVFDLVTPLLGNLPPIKVPSFAGFSLNNLSIQHVTTSQDDFLALYATLGAGVAWRASSRRHDPFAAEAVDAMDAALPPIAGAEHRPRARCVGVDDAGAPRRSAARCCSSRAAQLPTVTFDVDRVDSRGRELEWSWNFNGGMWHAVHRRRARS